MTNPTDPNPEPHDLMDGADVDRGDQQWQFILKHKVYTAQVSVVSIKEQLNHRLTRPIKKSDTAKERSIEEQVMMPVANPQTGQVIDGREWIGWDLTALSACSGARNSSPFRCADPGF